MLSHVGTKDPEVRRLCCGHQHAMYGDIYLSSACALSNNSPAQSQKKSLTKIVILIFL